MSRDLVRYRGKEVAPRVPEPTSLEAKIKAKLAEKFRPEVSGDFALLLDTTGSMWGDKIRKLRESVRAFSGVRRFQYADDIVELRPGEECREPDGNNNEERAFNTLKALGIGRVVMITDGYPDRPEGALAAAKGLHIDIIYIGPPPPPEFLRKLAAQCGGSFDPHVEFAKEAGARTLEAKIRGLLPAPSTPTEEKKGVILL